MNTQKRSLSFLKKRAKKLFFNRFYQEELIFIARTCTPSKAFSIAFDYSRISIDWDDDFCRDIARAVRFLAIIRRDYGTEAFEKFVKEQKTKDECDET